MCKHHPRQGDPTVLPKRPQIATSTCLKRLDGINGTWEKINVSTLDRESHLMLYDEYENAVMIIGGLGYPVKTEIFYLDTKSIKIESKNLK